MPDQAVGRDSRRWYVLILLCAAFFVVVLGSTIVFTAAPSMAADLGFASADISWVFTASALTSGGLLLFGGRLSDLLGRRRVFMTGVALFTFSSLLCGMAWSAPVLIGARTIQGAAVAIMTPAALALVTTTFGPGPDRNRALGIWSMIGGIGATGGLLTGGLVTDWLGWRWIFAINLPVGLAVLALSPLLLRERRDDLPERRAFDLAGAAAVTAAMVLLVYTITQVPHAGWLSAQTLGLLAASALLLAVFVKLELRSPDPLLPLRIFRSHPLVGGNLTMLVGGLAVDGMLFILTQYAQQVLGYSAIRFGLALAVMTFASIGASLLAQHLVTKVGFAPVAAAGLVLVAAASLMLSGVSVDGSFAADLLPGLLTFGLGMGALLVAGSIASLTGVPAGDAGVASGLQNTSFTLGTGLGVAVLSTVATARTADLVGVVAPTQATTTGYGTAFGVAAAVAILGLLVFLALTSRIAARLVKPGRR